MADKSALERLEKKLDDRSGETGVKRSQFFGRKAGTTPQAWAGEPVRQAQGRPRRMRMIEVVFICSLVFFVFAAAAATLLFFSGTNTVSTRNVSIAVAGPTSIRAGDSVPLTIVVTNRNSVPMQLTDLVIEFPSGTRSEADVSVALPRIRETLGDIAPGESVNKTVSSRIFGTAGTDATVHISVEYRVPSSNAIFHSETSYTAPISESPAAITVQGLAEAVSGQSTTLTITVASNVTSVLSHMILVAGYPPGFSFTSSSPAPLPGSAAWNLGDIEPGGKRTVTVTGVLIGDDGDSRVVHFTAGAASTANPATVSAPLATSDMTFAIAKPFVSASLTLDGDAGATHVVRRGHAVRADVAWQNNLPTRVQDLDIEVKLNGAILDRTSVQPDKGFFRSADNTVIFSSGYDPSFADVAPGASGVASFIFNSLPLGSGVFKNPQMDLTVTVTARRLSDTNVPETITSSASASAAVATDISLQSVLSRAGAFTNTGPIPPKADQESTYTVTWVVSNTSNAVANTSVSAVLPSYVRYTGLATLGEDVSYNAVGGIVTWKIGDLAEGAGRSVSFQIGITPSVSQVNQSPTLVSDQRISALDRFTGTTIESTAVSLTTQSGSTFQLGNVVP
jgi:hypothetical protein